MKITLVQIGKTTERHVCDGVAEYSSRMKRYIFFETVTITDLKNTRNMTSNEQKSKEGKKILESIRPDDYVILLDERGKEMRTLMFSEMLGKVLLMPKKRIVFIIGGAWGFSEEVYGRADFKMSLSQMTFPHQMVRLLFMEQLYRAFTIIKGEPYHHE